MKPQTALKTLCLGLIVTTSSSADARHCRRPGWDQGYGCYFAAPYVGTGRYCAGYGYGPAYPGSSYSYYGPAPVSSPIPATSVPAAAPAMSPSPAPAPTPPSAPSATPTP